MADDNLVAPVQSAPVATTPVVQAPATTTVPVQTQQVVDPKAVVPPTVPATSTEQLLAVPSNPKPTIESLKLIKDAVVPQERIASIVSTAKTIEEAQSLYEFTNTLYADGAKAMEIQNQTRLAELKGDPELGGQKWEETKAFYQSGMKRMFGEQAIKDLVDAKMDALPWLVRGIVRAERAATAKPIISAQPEAIKPENTMQPHERIYGPDSTYNALNPTKPLDKPRVAPKY